MRGGVPTVNSTAKIQYSSTIILLKNTYEDKTTQKLHAYRYVYMYMAACTLSMCRASSPLHWNPGKHSTQLSALTFLCHHRM